VGRSDSLPVPAAVAASSSPVSPPLAIVDKQLLRIDRQTLAPLETARVPVGSGGCASRSGGESCWAIPPWSFSPDNAQLAIARNGHSALESLRLVDVASLSVVADLRVPGGPIGALAWLAPSRVVALQEICCSGRQNLLVVDVSRQCVAARRALWGSVLRLTQTPRELVVLLAPPNRVGEARLAVADAQGALRIVRLGRVAAGASPEGGSTARAPISIPGLAVDSAGRRAFVVTPALVASIDLRKLAVSYHRPSASASLLARFRAWLEPAAQAKEATGPVRTARWLGGGLIAVTGAQVDRRESKPAGLRLVDTRTWRSRTIDAHASDVALGDDVLLATGGTTGVTAYKLDGRKRFRLFDGEQAWVDRVFDGRAYVGISGQRGPKGGLRVVDLAAGRSVGERPMPMPWLLVERSGGWWSY
jgi:hypothetical protein